MMVDVASGQYEEKLCLKRAQSIEQGKRIATA